MICLQSNDSKLSLFSKIRIEKFFNYTKKAVSSVWLLLKILNANPYFGIPLTEQETKDILMTGTLMIHVGTVDDKGHANIHPAWYYYDSSINKLYVQTGKRSMKTYNLRNKEIIYFCIDDQNPPYKGVRGKGIVKYMKT